MAEHSPGAIGSRRTLLRTCSCAASAIRSDGVARRSDRRRWCSHPERSDCPGVHRLAPTIATRQRVRLPDTAQAIRPPATVAAKHDGRVSSCPDSVSSEDERLLFPVRLYGAWFRMGRRPAPSASLGCLDASQRKAQDGRPTLAHSVPVNYAGRKCLEPAYDLLFGCLPSRITTGRMLA